MTTALNSSMKNVLVLPLIVGFTWEIIFVGLCLSEPLTDWAHSCHLAQRSQTVPHWYSKIKRMGKKWTAEGPNPQCKIPTDHNGEKWVGLYCTVLQSSPDTESLHSLQIHDSCFPYWVLKNIVTKSKQAPKESTILYLYTDICRLFVQPHIMFSYSFIWLRNEDRFQLAHLKNRYQWFSSSNPSIRMTEIIKPYVFLPASDSKWQHTCCQFWKVCKQSIYFQVLYFIMVFHCGLPHLF